MRNVPHPQWKWSRFTYAPSTSGTWVPTTELFIQVDFMECSDDNVGRERQRRRRADRDHPRIDGEGINMDAPPLPTREPSHPADGYAPKASNPSAATAPGSKRAQVTGSCSSAALA